MYGGRQGYKRKAWSYKGRAFAAKRRKAGAGRYGRFLPTTRSSTHRVQNAQSWRNHPGNPNRAQVAIARGATFIPERLRVPLTWTVDSSITIVSGVGNQLIISGNSIVDPGQSVASTAPYGFDQLSALYKRYCVYGSSIEVRFDTASGGTVTFPEFLISWVLWPSLDTTNYVSDEQAARQAPYSKNGSASVSQSTSPWGAGLARSYISTSKIQAVSPARVEMDAVYHGVDMSSNPSTTGQWFWNILINGTGSDVDNNIAVHFKVTYYTELYGLNDIAST